MLAALGLGYVWGEQRLASAEVADTGVRIRIVQANVDQADKWRPENSEEIFTSYLDLTRSGRSRRRSISSSGLKRRCRSCSPMRPTRSR